METLHSPTACEAGFHPTLVYSPEDDDGMGTWKCTSCGQLVSFTDISNHGSEETVRALSSALDGFIKTGRKPHFGGTALNELFAKIATLL